MDGKSDVSVNKMLDSFEDWAAACHIYRHALGDAETGQPSLEVTILIVSQGYAFARWLAEMVARKGE